MKKLLKSALIFFPLVAVIFIVNYYVDPASLLNKSLEKEIAKAFLDGHNVSDVSTIDDRAMIEFYFEQREESIDCLVLGASRGMQISKDTTGMENTFNSGVTGAEIRDIISIYSMYYDKFGAPENVILVLEPWTLSETYINKRCITAGYYDFCNRMFSIGYFQQSINPIFSGDFNLKKEISITDDFYGDEDIRHSDGSYSYSSSYMNMPAVEMQAFMADYKTKVPDLIKKYSYSEKLCEQFTVFVQELKDENVDVTFFIPPITPEYYEFLKTTDYFKCFSETWDTYVQIAKENEIEIIGEYNNESLTESDFYDILHPTYEYVYNLFETYRQ